MTMAQYVGYLWREELLLTVWLPLGDKGIHMQYSASSSRPFLPLTASHRPQWL